MKICVFAAGFLLIAGCALAAENGSPFDGKWSGETDSGMGGPTTLTYVFKTSGNTVIGTVMSSMDNKEVPIKDGKIDGKSISFGADVETQGMTLKYKSKGVLSGDEIKLTFDSESSGGAPGGGMMGGGMMGGGAPGGGMMGGMMGGGMMGGPPGGTGLTQDQTQKISDAVQSGMAALNTKLQDARKVAIAAALDKAATAEGVKEKIDAVAKIQAEIAVLRYSKGVKPIAKDITDDQKTQLTDNAAMGYQQLFSDSPGGGMMGGMMGGGAPGGGMMGGMMGGGAPGGGQSGSITLKKVK
jgi:hypothetical protein